MEPNSKFQLPSKAKRNKKSMQSKQSLKRSWQILKDINVLYVEDDAEILGQLALFLESKVDTVYTAYDGEEGLNLFKTHLPDVVVTDIKMPIKDGLQMAAAIKKIDKEIPIIVTTAFNEQEYFLESIDLGIDKYVLKPVDPFKLLSAIEKSVIVSIQKRELEFQNKYVHFILDADPNFMITTNKYGVEYINRTFLNFLGYASLDEFKKSKKSLGDFFINCEGIPFSNQEKHRWLHHMIGNIDKDILVYINSQNPKESGTRIFLITCNKFPELDKYIFSFTDITKFEKEKKKLEKQANTDFLTGVYNRNKIVDSLLSEINRSMRYRMPLSLIMFDIDSFKKINDHHGHEAGDSILKEITQVVSEHIRDTDILARWGGDEFLILVPETDLDETTQMAIKLNSVIKQSSFSEVGSVSSSFGVTQFKINDDISSFIKRADKALLKAKKLGRGRVEY